MTVHRCPACGTDNGVSLEILEQNETVGAELWGCCAACRSEFKVDRSDIVDTPATLLLQEYRSPRVSTMSFAMWHRSRHG